MISLHNVSKTYNHKQVLKPTSLRLEKSKTHVLLGSSGSGKSTLLRLIAGLIQPDSGEVRVGDIAVTQQSEVGDKIGYVIQEGGLFPHLTARQNVALVAGARGVAKTRVSGRIDELMELVELTPDLLKQFPKDLSGGQRQRVSLMRALMLDPPLLLMDEPLGALDPVVRRSLQDQLKRIFNQMKKTVVLVTHDIGEAAFFGHTITLLHDGTILQHGSFEDLVKRPSQSFVTEFLMSQRPPEELMEFFS